MSRSPTTTMAGLLPHEEHVCTHDLVEFWVWTRLVNPLNEREHWNVRSTRAARQRELVALTFFQALGARWHLEADPTRPKRVHFTAYVGRGFDDDGLVSSLKAIRDGCIDARLISGMRPRMVTSSRIPRCRAHPPPSRASGSRCGCWSPRVKLHDAAD